MARPPLTDAIQDYLKEIYKLSADEWPRDGDRARAAPGASRPPRPARW